MHSVAVYLIQRLYGGPEEGGWYYEAGEFCTVPELTAFGTTSRLVTRTVPSGGRPRSRRTSIAIGTSTFMPARSAASSAPAATWRKSTMAASPRFSD